MTNRIRGLIDCNGILIEGFNNIKNMKLCYTLYVPAAFLNRHLTEDLEKVNRQHAENSCEQAELSNSSLRPVLHEYRYYV